MSEEAFEWLHRKAVAYMQNRVVYVMVRVSLCVFLENDAVKSLWVAL